LNPGLKNRFFAVRHGQSEANAAALIASDPMVCTQGVGLTPAGREQVAASLKSFPHEFSARTLIVSSDFLRARQTAQIIADLLRISRAIQLSENLRERNFGQWEGQSVGHYELVWARDLADPSSGCEGVESAIMVRERAVAEVRRLEATHDGMEILLVSHGDVLQLLQTAFERRSPAGHRQLAPLQPAEMRELIPAQGLTAFDVH